jgi:paraquat-inducible protein B
MSYPSDPDEFPQATLEPPSRRPSLVWLIPAVAAAVAIGIAVQRTLMQGPVISIVFRQASGIEAGKTVLKYKDVTIGQVNAVRLADDYSKVEVQVQVDRSARGLMVEDARFWVVAPRVTLSGVSGLGTLLSGNYIGMETGHSTRERRHFEGLDTPPAITDQPGRRFILKASNLGSLGVGAPVYYRRLPVGEIAAYALSADGTNIDITVFVNTPYERFVTSGTRFWDASGIDLSLGADGLTLRTQSLVSLLAGGLAFDTPVFQEMPEQAPNGSVFPLYPDQTTAMKQPDALTRRYVLYPDTVQGLQLGAPVRVLGLTAGEVTDVGLVLDPKTQKFRPRLTIAFYPERLIDRMAPGQEALAQSLVDQSPEGRMKLIRHQIQDLGLRAEIRSGNLLTGERYVALEYHPDAPLPDIDWTAKPFEMPLVKGELADIESRVTSVLGQVDAILDKVDRIPLPEIGARIDTAMASLDRILKSADSKTLPDLSRTMEGLRRTLGTADRVIQNTDTTLLGPDAPGQQDLRNALQEVGRAARSLRVLADYLERHPEALIRGKATDPD